MRKELYCGDNLGILRDKIASDSVDLCYIDPPFNSKRDYNLIYNNADRVKSQAFVDTWRWDDKAEKEYAYLADIKNINDGKIPAQTSSLIRWLAEVVGRGDLMAYLVFMAVRIIEIHRVLKPTGSFYLHCDPTASHYIKILVDSIFLTQKGEFRNEIVWHYTGGGRSKRYFSWKHDLIFCYSKTLDTSFNIDNIRVPYKETSSYAKSGIVSKSGKKYMPSPLGTPMDDVWNIPIINPMAKERLGLETQKPEALLEIIIKASSNEGDVVLDAFCGSGTTVAVAERLNRQWVGIDIGYQQISLTYKRLYDSCADDNQRKELDKIIKLCGMPQNSA